VKKDRDAATHELSGFASNEWREYLPASQYAEPGERWEDYLPPVTAQPRADKLSD
jgi:hypothetical protein